MQTPVSKQNADAPSASTIRMDLIESSLGRLTELVTTLIVAQQTKVTANTQTNISVPPTAPGHSTVAVEPKDSCRKRSLAFSSSSDGT